MGKKSKNPKKNPNKVHIKVKREHINIANTEIRKLFKERFENPSQVISNETESNNSTPELTNNEKSDTSVTENNSPPDPEILEKKFREIIDFYQEQKHSKSDLISSGRGDPVKMAFNNLCDNGIRATLNHAHACGLPPSSLKNLSIKGMYGIDPEILQHSDSDEEGTQEEVDKLNKVVQKTNVLLQEKKQLQNPPPKVTHNELKYF